MAEQLKLITIEKTLIDMVASSGGNEEKKTEFNNELQETKEQILKLTKQMENNEKTEKNLQLLKLKQELDVMKKGQNSKKPKIETKTNEEVIYERF